LRVPAELCLREDQLAVQRDLEAPFRGGDQLDGSDDGRPSGEKFVRQTDGTRNIVSGDAELDFEVMPGVDHADLDLLGG